MSQFERAGKLSDEQFLRVVGVDKATFKSRQTSQLWKNMECD